MLARSRSLVGWGGWLVGCLAVLSVGFGMLGASGASAATTPVWPATSEYDSYANPVHNASQQFAYFDQISCPSRGNCVGAGSYENSKDQPVPMVATESGGVWGQASVLAQPSGASSTYAWLASLNCTSTGNCVAGGQYLDTGGGLQPMVATETGGVWGQAQELSLPSGADSAPAYPGDVVDSVDCTSQGNCVASGQYLDTNGDFQAMVATETGGVWGQAQEVSLPSNAASTTDDDVGVYSVSCTSQGNCVGGGEYVDTNGDVQAMLVTESGGVWGQASGVSLPSNANPTAGDQSAAVDSVNCTSQGNCVAGGSYEDTNGAGDYQAMVATETGGVWSQASELALPSGANTTAGGQSASVDSVDCTTQGYCVASGDYEDTNGSDDYQAMVATESGGVWGQASELALPSNESTTAGAQDASVSTVSCTSAGYCVGGGGYVDTSGGLQAMVVSSVGSLSVASSSLSAAGVGVAYDAQLSASGGAPSYSWSVASGSLPAGLSLSSSGVVSGTPTKAGTSTFTVRVADPGPPAQQATGTVSITVYKRAKKVVKFDDQKITLTSPSPLACVAPPGKLAVTFKSARIRHSKKAKLRFVSASFYIDKGVRKHHKYVANATKKHVPVSLKLSLAGLKSGNHTLKVVAAYKTASGRTVHKKLRVKFKVC